MKCLWGKRQDTHIWMHSDTHGHESEGVGYHFAGIGQYLNTYSG